MATTNHSSNASKSVLDLAAYLLRGIIDKNDTATQEEMSVITFEVMTELEKCFKVRYRRVVSSELTTLEELPENEEWDNVGDEQFYKAIEKSIVADLAAMQYLFNVMVGKTNTASSTSGGGATFIKKAKAGSAEVEYDQFKTASSQAFILSNEKLLGKLKGDAERKALQLGCVIDICDDCIFKAYLNDPMAFVPNNFLVVRSFCS